MSSLNKVFLIGNITKDPELRYTANGTAVTTLRLASNRRWQGGDGQKREETLFVDVVVWGKQAEAAAEHLAKGSSVLVEGRLQSRDWEGRDGQKRTTIDVIAERLQFLGRPSGRAPATIGEPSGEPTAPPPAEDDPF